MWEGKMDGNLDNFVRITPLITWGRGTRPYLFPRSLLTPRCWTYLIDASHGVSMALYKAKAGFGFWLGSTAGLKYGKKMWISLFDMRPQVVPPGPFQASGGKSVANEYYEQETCFSAWCNSEGAMVPFEERILIFIFILALFTQRENKVIPDWNAFSTTVILYQYYLHFQDLNLNSHSDVVCVSLRYGKRCSQIEIRC